MNLAATKHRLEGQFEEKLASGGKKGSQRVCGWGGERVNSEVLTEDQGGRTSDEGGKGGMQDGDGEEGRRHGERGELTNKRKNGPRLRGGWSEDEARFG